MASKKSISRKIRILKFNHFEMANDAFNFFDKSDIGRLNKKEIVKLLKETEISGSLKGIVSSKLNEGYDTDVEGDSDWQEFKAAIDEINKAAEKHE